LTETVEKTASGAIVYDKAIINQISDKRFAAEGWLHAEPVQGALRSAGRGGTLCQARAFLRGRHHHRAHSGHHSLVAVHR
jgi:hypothetical protein